MANYIYGALSLTGGALGALDSLNGIELNQDDIGLVFTPTTFYIYYLNETIGGASNPPALIVPISNAGSKRWVLTSTRAADSSLNVSAFSKLLGSSTDSVQKALDAIDDAFNSSDFSVTAGDVSLQDVVLKSIVTNSGTVTPSGHSVSILGSGKIKTSGSSATTTISIDDLSIVTKNTNYVITSNNDIVIGDCAGGNVQLTLPDVTTKSVITIAKKSNSNTLTINCHASQTINGSSTKILTNEYDIVRLVSDGANTWIVSI